MRALGALAALGYVKKLQYTFPKTEIGFGRGLPHLHTQ